MNATATTSPRSAWLRQVQKPYFIACAALLGMALLSAAQGSVDFASGTIGLFIGAYLSFLGTQPMLFRRDAHS